MAFGTDFGLTKQEDEQAWTCRPILEKNGQMTVDLLPDVIPLSPIAACLP